ncbi:hypothetical protein CTI12_AA379350 [Artemisia annua]|uniref:Reverse transcriptase zinc-binding domain-containing protein n=1 Tax=Artemisia annua TaxID=35608 RepID=A0A2U1MHS7_ARTAN|nr:hypothetical protein CTI12_AA379350 [Artemisia annua]
MGTLWCNDVPKKVNMFAWRVMLDRLPIRYNLTRREIEIESILCPTCGVGMEILSHALFACFFAKECDLFPSKNNRSLKMQVIGLAACWMIWRFRNSVLFDASVNLNEERFLNLQLMFFLSVDLVRKESAGNLERWGVFVK